MVQDKDGSYSIVLVVFTCTKGFLASKDVLVHRKRTVLMLDDGYTGIAFSERAGTRYNKAVKMHSAYGVTLITRMCPN